MQPMWMVLGPFTTTFWRVMLPGAGNSLLIVFLFSFVWQWNDIFLSTLYLGGSLGICRLRCKTFPKSCMKGVESSWSHSIRIFAE